MAQVIVSRLYGNSYHEDFCPYVKRMTRRKRMSETKAKEKGYCECKFCHSVRGLVYKYKKLPPFRDISYDKVDDAFCIRTNVGFWKLIWSKRKQTWALWHMNGRGSNCFDASKKNEELMRGSFHRQDRFLPTSSIMEAINYIESHDRNYDIAEHDNIKKLNRGSKKQKLHYRQQRNRKRKESLYNVYKIIDELKENG